MRDEHYRSRRIGRLHGAVQTVHDASDVSLVDFIDRLNEQSNVWTPNNKSSKDLIATIIGIASFGMFNNIFG